VAELSGFIKADGFAENIMKNRLEEIRAEIETNNFIIGIDPKDGKEIKIITTSVYKEGDEEIKIELKLKLALKLLTQSIPYIKQVHDVAEALHDWDGDIRQYEIMKETERLLSDIELLSDL